MYPLICFKILLLIATVALRSTAITSLTTTYLGESGRYASAALVYDTRWIALCGLLMLLSYATRNRWVWGCLQWLSSGVIALAVLDLYIFQTTWQRLSWDGVITFGGEWSAAVDLFVKNLHKPDVLACSALLGVALLLLLAEPVVLWRLPPLKSPRRVYVALGSPALLALAVAPTPWLESRALGTVKPLAVDVLTYQWAYSTPPAVDAATKAAFIERYAALHPAAQPPSRSVLPAGADKGTWYWSSWSRFRPTTVCAWPGYTIGPPRSMKFLLLAGRSRIFTPMDSEPIWGWQQS